MKQNEIRIIQTERNERWLQGDSNQPGLLKKIQNAEKPIAILVGAAHLYGPLGLVDAFGTIFYVSFVVILGSIKIF